MKMELSNSDDVAVEGMSPYVPAMICTCIMFFMNFAALAKSLDPNNHPAEDAVLGINDAKKEEHKAQIEAQGGFNRWNRVAGNQGEQFPMALAVLWCSAVVAQNVVSAACFVIYTVVRCGYTVCYLRGLQPWRTLLFLVSQLTVVAAGINAIVGGSDNIYRCIGAVCTLVLYLMNFFALFKAVDPSSHPPEDEVLKLQSNESGERFNRVAVNQSEQLPFALAVLGGAGCIGANPLAITCCFIFYVIFRMGYIFCYIKGLSPARSIVFFCGQLTAIAGGILGIMAAVGRQENHVGHVLAMVCTQFMFIMNFAALVKSIDPHNHPAEDAAIGMDDTKKEEHKKKVEAQGGVDRWTRIAVNQREQFPCALAVLWGAIIVGGNIEALGYLFFAYVSGRLVFIKCYLSGLQPYRTFVFLFGQVIVMVGMVFGLLSML